MARQAGRPAMCAFTAHFANTQALPIPSPASAPHSPVPSTSDMSCPSSPLPLALLLPPPLLLPLPAKGGGAAGLLPARAFSAAMRSLNLRSWMSTCRGQCKAEEMEPAAQLGWHFFSQAVAA